MLHAPLITFHFIILPIIGKIIKNNKKTRCRWHRVEGPVDRLRPLYYTAGSRVGWV